MGDPGGTGVGVDVPGLRRVCDCVRRLLPGRGRVNPPRTAPPNRAATTLPPAGWRRPRPEPVGSAVPGKSRRRWRPDREGPLRPERFPQDLENAGAASRLAAGQSGERDAFPTLPTGSPWSLEFSGKDCPVESLGVRRSAQTPTTPGVPTCPGPAPSGPPANSPSARSYNAGKQTKRSFHSHRPTHGTSDNPAPLRDSAAKLQIARSACGGPTPRMQGPPPPDPRYRPDLPQPIPVIDRTSPTRSSLSTGPPSADPVIDRTSPQPIPVIDRTSLNRSPLSTGPLPPDPRYRPDLSHPILVIDRTSPTRSSLSTGPPSADPVIDRTSPQPILVIDRTSPTRSPLSTGPLPPDPRYRPDLPLADPEMDACSGHPAALSHPARAVRLHAQEQRLK